MSFNNYFTPNKSHFVFPFPCIGEKPHTTYNQQKYAWGRILVLEMLSTDVSG